jgi:hypothetical protein
VPGGDLVFVLGVGLEDLRLYLAFIFHQGFF